MAPTPPSPKSRSRSKNYTAPSASDPTFVTTVSSSSPASTAVYASEAPTIWQPDHSLSGMTIDLSAPSNSTSFLPQATASTASDPPIQLHASEFHPIHPEPTFPVSAMLLDTPSDSNFSLPWDGTEKPMDIDPPSADLMDYKFEPLLYDTPEVDMSCNPDHDSDSEMSDSEGSCFAIESVFDSWLGSDSDSEEEMEMGAGMGMMGSAMEEMTHEFKELVL